MNYMKLILDELDKNEVEKMSEDDLEAILEYLEEYDLQDEYEWLIDDILAVAIKRIYKNMKG